MMLEEVIETLEGKNSAFLIDLDGLNALGEECWHSSLELHQRGLGFD